ncbi:MAG: formate dehydrogenase subunit alpha [bacterium]|nr:formate dehydrogenase subunit alpha [bacterium]
MLRISIDGKTIEVEEGTYIFDAATKLGIEIPAFCYCKGLKPYGGCRLCIVEVKGEKKPVASCSYPITKEIEVLTKTDEIVRLRKNIISLLLSNHPNDCMTCEKSGNCLLEKYAYEYGIKKPYFPGEKSKAIESDGKPFIIRDYEKCILCGKCVRVCEEIVGAQAIDFGCRGFDTQIISGFNESLLKGGCIFCGNCIEVCPVGALREVGSEGRGRTWEFKKIKTVCPYCGVGCGIEVSVKNSSIIRISGDFESPVNSGFLCVKGKFGFEFVNHPDRLKKPLIRVNGTKMGSVDFKEVDWETAIRLTSEKFKEIKENYGADALAGLASARCTNEENYLFQKFFRQIIGTNNVDHCARLCHAPSVAALAMTVGSGAMTNSLKEIEEFSDCIILTGTNVSETQPVTSYKIRKAVQRGARLIVIDPKEIEIARFAEIYVQQIPGTDVMLFNGIAKVILDEHLFNENFIKEHVEGFEEFREFMKRFNLDQVEQITGVSKETIRKIAQIYSRSNSSVIVWAMGITQHTTGTDNAFTLSNLALLTGQIGKPGAGLCPLRGQNNVQGACDMGALPNFLPGYQKIEHQSIRKKFEGKWGVELSEKPGLTIIEIFSAIHDGQIKGLYIMGENPLISDPDINFTREALEKVDFLVVQDIFLTETAKYADIIFPAACSFEKEGTFTNTERRIQKINPCVNPPGDAKPDWLILSELAKQFNFDWKYRSPGEIMEEIAELTPIYTGVNYERLSKQSLQWPCPEISHPGTCTLHTKGFPIEKAKLKCVNFLKPFEIPDDEFPFVLTTGRILFEYHTRTMTGRVNGLKKISGTPYCEINYKDAKRLLIKEGQLIKLVSRRGEIMVRVKVSKKIMCGTIFMPFHYGESAANVLTHHHLDPIAKIPEFKICAVRIEKL